MRTLVVGVGNDQRGDDGAGPLVARLLARALAAAPPPGVEVVPWIGDPLGLLECLEAVDRLVVVDAVVSGAAVGACRRFGLDAPFAEAAGASTHGFGVAATLALARALGRAPDRVDVWGIEGAEFASGAPLTPAVARSARALAGRLARELAPRGPRGDERTEPERARAATRGPPAWAEAGGNPPRRDGP